MPTTPSLSNQQGRVGMSSTIAPDPTVWSRRRLLGILAVAVVTAMCLLGGLVYAVVLAVGGVDSGTGPGGGAGSGPSGSVIDQLTTGTESSLAAKPRLAQGVRERDRIAAAPMLAVPERAMLPGPPDVRAVSPSVGIQVPDGDVVGPGQILTGFPRTPQGAIGQLAQIDLAVLQMMSLPTAREVYRAWALPGGIGPDRWWITQSVHAFLTSTSMGEVLDPSAGVEIEPAAAMVKGTDGPDWTVVCVLLKVTATYRQEGQVAFGHCERMQWAGGHWMIAPGHPPAPAPSTWPGTGLAIQAGWRTWRATP